MVFVAAQSAAGAVQPQMVVTPTTFVFIGERLWLDFVNTDDLRRGVRVDVLRDFDALIQWLGAAGVLDAERASGITRRAEQQPAGAAAALVDARRVRAALRALAERCAVVERCARMHSSRSTACSVGVPVIDASSSETMGRSSRASCRSETRLPAS